VVAATERQQRPRQALRSTTGGRNFGSLVVTATPNTEVGVPQLWTDQGRRTRGARPLGGPPCLCGYGEAVRERRSRSRARRRHTIPRGPRRPAYGADDYTIRAQPSARTGPAQVRHFAASEGEEEPQWW
jgi:hypothetical protein